MRCLLTAILLLLSAAAQCQDAQAPTRALDGAQISYEYSSGRSYHVRFSAQGVSYRYLTGSKPEKWWGPFPYTAFEVGPDQFMAAWFEEAYGDYVTLLINFDQRVIHGSAILRGEEVRFHPAKLLTVERKTDLP